MLAGLSGLYIRNMPPAFWANAGPTATKVTRIGAAIAIAPTCGFVQNEGYSSSQTSSMRQPLKTLLTIILRPLTRGCQQVAKRK
jgi:hypothetical protein